MKHNIKYVISLVFMLLLTQGAWAEQAVTIITKLNGAAVTTTSPGNVTSAIENGTCTLTVTPASGYYVTKDNITAYSVVTGNVAQAPQRRSPNLDNGPIEVTPKNANADPAGETQYTFAMPDDGSDVEVTVNFKSYQMYSLYIGSTQVTELNAEDVLKDGKVSFTPASESDNNVNTLTLNGATLTVPVKVGLSNLTIDIQGTNTITTAETCLQKIDDAAPAVTFLSTSTTVGSLTLTNTGNGGVNNIGVDNVGSFSFSNQFAVLLTVYEEEDYTSNTYYFTDGSTSVAKIVPSYGVKVGDMQVYADNASDVLKDGKVSFDKSTSKLTLNGASISGVISTSLSNLTIELVGDNMLSQGGSYAALQSSTGEAVTMTIQSTGQTTGSLTMNMPYTNAGTFADEHVTLNITSPLTVVSGSLTGNNKNDNTVVIGESYGLTVAGVTVSKFNASAITGNQIQLNNGGSVSFDLQQKTLTLNNVGFNATSSAPIISSNLDSLTVNIVGSVWFNFNETDPAYVFQSTYNNAVLTFTTTDENPVLSIPRGIDAGAFTGFKTVEYKNGLALSVKEGDVPSYTIALMEAPFVGDFSIDEETGMLTGYIGTANDYEGATIKYAITYADGVHQNVPETSYEESVSLEGPATLTAYIVVGESQSPVTTAKYYGYTQHEIADTLGKTSVAMPAIIPAIQEGDGLTVSYLSDEDIASVADGVIVKGGKVGTTAISAVLSIGVAEPSFTVLNDNYENGYRVEGLTVTVVPTAPSVSLEGGTYDGKQYVTLTPNLPEGVSGFIHYKRIVDGVEKVDSTYSVPLTIDETTTLTYYQEAFDDEGQPFNSETKSVTYVIRQNPELHFWTSDMSYISTGGDYGTIDFDDLGRFTSPTLKAKMGENYTSNLTDLGITYSTSDETVATVDATGKVTIVGGGYVTIKAVSQQTDVYAADSTWYEIAVRPNAPQISLEKGVYYTGTKVGLNATMPNGKMYYKIGDNDTPTEYTDSITLPVGTNEIIAYTYCGTGEKIMESYGGRMVFFVYDKPVFSVASGTYNEPQEVTITTNIPDNDPYVALYYKLNNSQTDSTLYHAGDKIMITETTRVCAYYWVQESDKYVSDPVEAHYVIRQDAGLAFVPDGEYVEVAEYTIGGNENLPLPTLQNENNLTVTYSSENTNVATVDATTGEVTIVGIGETRISATSEQTDVLLEGYAEYPLRVFKDLNYESITVSVADATYTGSAVTPAVTVMDGQTDISAFFDFAYSDNVQVGTNAKVTISPKELTDANNYYVGERTESFTINNRTLEVGKDVQFAEGQKWASLYTTTESLNLPEGVMAYIVTEVSATAATVTPINYVPKNVPVFLENGSTVTTENTSAEGNLLRGTSEQTAVSSIQGKVFGLHNNNLMRVTSGSIPAGRAYLVTDEPQARELSIVFDTDITGIRMTTVNTADDDNWYTMDGRKLQQKPVKKGVYIRNGKKVVINNK